ncbi:hypothetical protein Tco_1091902 [Tanacetum coccineum]|uniref:Tf2-1-like SH3-like domain-containing protein n=1 Tax=Tanacetum coccineum TaxID=301880 RepID=A0ABQ5I8C1_9ASTR
MDCLSKRKFVIVCHEKVVRIPMEGDEILQVYGKRTLGAAKGIMNAKSKEEYEVHLKFVLESRRKEKMYAKFSKCDALSRKERVKSRRVRGMILAAQSEAFKQENVPLVGSEMDEAHASSARDRQKSYVDYGRKPLKFEVGDHVLLKVMPWKGVVHFGKKGKLALRYVGPFEILERIGLVAYRLRLPEELNIVHDTFHANLHVPLNEIKIDKTLHFVEEPVEIMDREVKCLKRSRIPLVKVC